MIERPGRHKHVTEEAFAEVVIDAAVGAANGFLRSLPLLSVRYMARSTYHFLRWREAYRLDLGLFDHDFVHLRAVAEPSDSQHNLVAYWQRRMVHPSESLYEFVRDCIGSLSGRLYLVTDDATDLYLSPKSIRALDHILVPIRYDNLFTTFLRQFDDAGLQRPRCMSHTAILPAIGAVEHLGGGRTATLTDLSVGPNAILPNIILRRLARRHPGRYGADLIDRTEIRQFLLPWLDDKGELDALTASLSAYHQNTFDPEDATYSARLDRGLQALSRCPSPVATYVREVVSRCAI